jgi:hypothetical protein
MKNGDIGVHQVIGVLAIVNSLGTIAWRTIKHYRQKEKGEKRKS